MSLAAALSKVHTGYGQPGEMSPARFYQQNGIEIPAVTSYQMREIERVSWEETGPDALYMTERAGLALALLASELLSTAIQERQPRVLVLVGPGAGNQAGICAARHLTELRLNTRICFSNPPFAGQFLSYQHHIYESAGGHEIEIWNLHQQKPDLIIDALLDYRTGERSASGNIPGMIRWANQSSVPVLAFDIPSGLHPTTGEARGECIHPAWTLTAGLPKSGLRPELTGQLFLADIGLRGDTLQRTGISYMNPFDNRLWIPLASEANGPGLDW